MEPVLVAEGKPLSQVERVVDTFIAPSKTFTDLRRSASWWLPFLIFTVVAVFTIEFAVKKVGIVEMGDSIIRSMPKLQDQIESSPPDQAAKIRQSIESRTKSNTYSIPIAVLIAGFAIGGLYLATANFVFGGKAKYMQMVALFWYSLLPLLLQNFLIIGTLSAGVGVENYNAQNPIGTNVGYYMDGSSPVLTALMTALDVFSIWVAVLQVIGVAKVAEIKKSSASIVVILWWVVYIGVFKLLPAALFS